MALASLNTNSVISGPGGADATFTGLSTLIVIKVNSNPVGAIQNISITESRNVVMISELGTDGNIDSTPSQSPQYSGTVNRIRFDRLRLTESFGRGFVHIFSQRIPFDVDIFDNWNGDGSNAIITTLKNVWFDNLQYNYESSNFLITEQANFKFERLYSTLNGGSAAQGGLLGRNTLQLNDIEQAADTGTRLGSLDSPGLINAFFSA